MIHSLPTNSPNFKSITNKVKSTIQEQQILTLDNINIYFYFLSIN